MTIRTVLAAVGSASMIAAAAWAADPVDDGPKLPLTYGQVWYRTAEHGGFGGGRLKGDLTLAREGLLFASPKREVAIAWSDISMIGLGKMRGDVDTDWVVLAVRRDDRRERIAFRDGSRWGYGEKTPGLYDTLRSTLRSMHQAQFSAPDGYVPYTRLDRQFAWAIPESWEVRHLELWEVDGYTSRGLFVVRHPGTAESDLAAERAAVTDGDRPVWAVARVASPDGATCEGAGRAAEERIRAAIVDSPFVSDGASIEPGPGEPVSIDACRGLRFRLAAGDGGRTEREIWAVSDGRTLFLFGVAAPVDRFAEERDRFRIAMDRVRFSPARAPAG